MATATPAPIPATNPGPNPTPTPTGPFPGEAPPARAGKAPGLVPAPTGAWQGVSWFAFAVGALTFLYTVWYSPDVTATDRYFLYTACLFSWFGALSVSKAVRDRSEGIPVTGLFHGLSYVAAIAPFILVAFNLFYDSPMAEANRALIGMAYALSTFAVLAIAKNERDKQAARNDALNRMPSPQSSGSPVR